MAYSSDDDRNFYDSDDYDGYGGGGSSDDEGEWCSGGGAAACAGGGVGGESAKKKEDEVNCECRKCMDEKLGKHTICERKEHHERSIRIEKQELAEYTERNGHLAKNDPLRHACGNGAVEKRRYRVLIERSFCVSAPNPSAPAPYMETDGGVVYPFGRPNRPGEVKNDEKFRESFKTPEGMTVRHYRRLIDDYYLKHEKIGTHSFVFPRHIALAMASQSSTCSVLERALWNTENTGIRFGHGFMPTNTNEHFQRMFVAAKKHTQDTFQITRFTEMSGLQRDMVLAHSGIAGIAISRLFNPKWLLTQGTQGSTYKTRVKHSRMVVRRVHSEEECEIFADNRYGKLWKHEEKASDESNILAKNLGRINDAEMTVEMAREELRGLYSSEIPKIMEMIQKFNRGILNLDDIHSKPEFRRLILLWIYCLKKQMALQETCQGETRVACLNKLMGIAAEFPLMYSTEMLRVYSASHSRLVKTSIESFLRLSSNAETIDPVTDFAVGCRSALLAFAAVEPRMVDQYLAPRLAICRYDGNDLPAALDNHIPSRCPIFGELRKKFEVHLPRTGDCEWELCRKNGGSIKSFHEYVAPGKM
jgi:hypothetical protein